jgi:hypothetical protein
MARAEDGFFDDLARGLADGSLTRGKALRLMGAALVGGALASLPGTALADDDCRSFGRRCRRDSQCCSKNCVRRGDGKVCGCPEGQRRCNDRCVNLQRNENHCGSCSNRCAAEETCVNGACCPNAQVCGIPGTSLTCCAEGQECPGGLSCQAPCPSGTYQCWNATESICCSEENEQCWGSSAGLICCYAFGGCNGGVSAAGVPTCWWYELGGDMCEAPNCNTDTDCLAGQVCIHTNGCPSGETKCYYTC